MLGDHEENKIHFNDIHGHLIGIKKSPFWQLLKNSLHISNLEICIFDFKERNNVHLYAQPNKNDSVDHVESKERPPNKKEVDIVGQIRINSHACEFSKKTTSLSSFKSNVLKYSKPYSGQINAERYLYEEESMRGFMVKSTKLFKT
jgi:hypothetical protein